MELLVLILEKGLMSMVPAVKEKSSKLDVGGLKIKSSGIWVAELST